ncbi:MAG: hypothetical protein NC485_05125 [Ruminococcus flavefaciens]|nr:hypothetical protein [Ruminococcus flavefaciens]MCM1059357.1 hypothetical protein [Eubacterium sp.]
MIVLKILLTILLVVFGIILLIFIIPMGGELSYIDGKLKYRVNLWIINIMDSDGGGIFNWLKRKKSRKKVKPPKKKYQKPESVLIEKNLEETEICESSEPAEIPAIPGDSDVMESEFENRTDDAEMQTSLSDEKETDDSVTEIKERSEKTSKRKKTKKSYADNEEKDSLEKKFNMLFDVWNSAKRPVHKIFKGFKFSDFYIDFVIANEDAYKCALNYGKISAAFYRILAQMSRLFTVRLKTVDIQPGFGLSKSRWDVSFRLSLRLGTFVIAGIWFLITYIFRVFLPNKIKRKKTAENQK